MSRHWGSTMKTIAGLAVIVVITAGSVLAARSHAVITPSVNATEATESHSEEVASFIQVDPDDWR